MRRLSQVLIVLGLMLSPMQSHAQSQELTEAIEQAGKLYKAERFQEALPLLGKTIDLSEREFGPDDPRIAGLLNALGALHSNQGRYAEAEPVYKRALAIREKALGPEHRDVAITLRNLAVLYSNQGRYAEAESLYKRALAIWEKGLGPNHPNVASGLSKRSRV
jgi:tetratricopeptide (TPR) repeat protein